MLTKRIIPCLDIKDGKVVKGVNFANVAEVGDPIALAREYQNQGADEVVFLDITATNENRDSKLTDTIATAARELTIPIAVGGGIRSVEDFRRILNAGASKVAVNSAAVANPKVIAEAAAEFGSRAVVAAIDAKQTGTGGWEVVVKGGHEGTGLDLIDWAREVERLGAGEILLTSLDRDGTRDGFDLDQLNAVAQAVNIPVVASGGCGDIGDIVAVFENTGADAALAASLFHYGDATVGDVKSELAARGIPVRQN